MNEAVVKEAVVKEAVVNEAVMMAGAQLLVTLSRRWIVSILNSSAVQDPRRPPRRLHQQVAEKEGDPTYPLTYRFCSVSQPGRCGGGGR